MKEVNLRFSQDEIMEILALTRVEFTHDRDAKTPTGIRAILKGFQRGEQSLSVNEVEKQLLEYVEGEGLLPEEGYARRYGKLVATHHWGLENEEGNQPSVYTCHYEVKANVFIPLGVV